MSQIGLVAVVQTDFEITITAYFKLILQAAGSRLMSTKRASGNCSRQRAMSALMHATWSPMHPAASGAGNMGIASMVDA